MRRRGSSPFLRNCCWSCRNEAWYVKRGLLRVVMVLVFLLDSGDGDGAGGCWWSFSWRWVPGFYIQNKKAIQSHTPRLSERNIFL